MAAGLCIINCVEYSRRIWRRLKRRLPADPRERKGKRVHSPRGEYFPEGVIQIALVFGVIGLAGTVASVISLVITLCDRRNARKEK